MKQKLLSLIGLTTVLVSSSYSAALALTWNLIGTVNSDDGITYNVGGNFTVDESNGSFGGANITISNGGDILTFAGPFINGTPTVNFTGTGIDGLNLTIDNNTGGCTAAFCNLNLAFAPELTTAGGTVSLLPISFLTADTSVNSFGPGGDDPNSGFVNGNATTQATNVVPFDFSSTPGLVALGLIVGVGKGRKHLLKVKEKFASLVGKK